MSNSKGLTIGGLASTPIPNTCGFRQSVIREFIWHQCMSIKRMKVSELEAKRASEILFSLKIFSWLFRELSSRLRPAKVQRPMLFAILIDLRDDIGYNDPEEKNESRCRGLTLFHCTINFIIHSSSCLYDCIRMCSSEATYLYDSLRYPAVACRMSQPFGPFFTQSRPLGQRMTPTTADRADG